MTIRPSSAAAIGAAGLLLGTLAGCGSSTKNVTNAAQASVSPTSGSSAPSTAAWLTAVHEDNMAEVQAGAMAQKKAARQAVRDTGRMLEVDHGLIDAGITMLADKYGVTLPTQLNDTLATELKKLQGLDGKAFEQSFVPFFIAGHKAAIAATEGVTTSSSPPADVVSYSKVVLPVLQRHLSHLEQDAKGD